MAASSPGASQNTPPSRPQSKCRGKVQGFVVSSTRKRRNQTEALL